MKYELKLGKKIKICDQQGNATDFWKKYYEEFQKKIQTFFQCVPPLTCLIYDYKYQVTLFICTSCEIIR